MAQHPHRCFGRTDVSDKERSLLQFNGRGPESPGGMSDRYDNELSRYISELRSATDNMKRGAPLDFQIWAERDFQQQVDEALARRAHGGPARPIRTVQDMHYESHMAEAEGSRGVFVDRSNNYINRGPTARAEYEWRLYQAGQGQMPRGNRQVNSGFRERYPSDVASGRISAYSADNEPNVLRAEQTRKAVERHTDMINARARVANTVIAEVRQTLAANAKSNIGSYWGTYLKTFNAEIHAFMAGQPKRPFNATSDGPYVQWITDSGAHMQRTEARLAKWQQIAAGTMKLPPTPEEIAELQRQYVRTQELLVAFSNAWIPASKLAGSTAPPEERRPIILKAVTAINALGSHYYKYFRGTEVPDEARIQYAKFAEQHLRAAGLIGPKSKVTHEQVTADEKGIQNLLELRTEMLASLTIVKAGDRAELQDLQAAAVAGRREVEYLGRTGVLPERSAKVQQEVGVQSVEICKQLKDKTDGINVVDDVDGKLNAAEKELVYLQTHHTSDQADRILSLFNRNPANPGFIQAALNVKHEALRTKTTEALDTSPTSVADIRAALDVIRTEGRFLRKHHAVMTTEASARMEELIDTQGRLYMSLTEESLKNLPADPIEMVARVDAVLPDCTWFGSTFPTRSATHDMYKALAKVVCTDIRQSVNTLIVAADKADPTTRDGLQTVEKAITAANAEMSLLTKIGIDDGQVRMDSLFERVNALEAKTDALNASLDRELSTSTKAPVDSFSRAWQVIDTKERIMRAVTKGTIDPKLEEKIKADRARILGFLTDAVNASVPSLNGTSSLDDIKRVSTLVAAEEKIRSNGGVMADVKRYSELQAHRETIEKIQAQVQRAIDEKPLVQADAVLTSVEAPITETNLAKKVAELDRRIKLLFETDSTMLDWKDTFNSEKKPQYVTRIDEWMKKKWAIDSSLRATLQRTLVEIGDAPSLVRAANLFDQRYMQFMLDEKIGNSMSREKSEEEIEKIRTQLLDDLTRGPDGLLPKATEANALSPEVMKNLVDFKNQLEGNYDSRHASL